MKQTKSRFEYFRALSTKWTQKDIFPTHPNLAEILGDMDLDLENFRVWDVSDSKFLDSPTSQNLDFPTSQILDFPTS